jgi:hypothetical protein
VSTGQFLNDIGSAIVSGVKTAASGGKWLWDNTLGQLIPNKTGSITHFTGPMWIDGTPSAPEMVLNA